MIRGKCLALLTYFDLCAGMVVNRPWAGGSNSAKPYHIRRLKAVGFDVPPSLSTNDPREARAFLEQWSGRVVYKSNGTARSIVHLVEGVDLERLHLIEGCPVLFQRYIAGSDVRVHVVGDQIFAEEIISPCVDYRHAEGNASKPHVLPEAIAQKCVTATRMEGLIFAGIDFKICAEDGKYYALEVNPMPGYDGYDRRLGCVISSALISLLQGHT